MPEQPMMMMPQIQQPEPEPEPEEAISDRVLRKYEDLVGEMRHAIVYTVKQVDPHAWEEEAECLHMVMFIDAQLSKAQDWIDEHREKHPDDSNGTPSTNGKKDDDNGPGQYM